MRGSRIRGMCAVTTMLALVALAAVPACSAEEGPSSASREPAGPAPASGLMIYVDPHTGALLREPAPGAVPLPLSPKLQNALSTSHQGLVEVPSTVPGGGVRIDLQGRFQHPYIATIDSSGAVRIQHLPALPDSGDRN